jgi:hypothetical protein
MNGHFGQSTGGGVCGQHGMSSDMLSIATACAAPATAGAANGPAISPAITKIASTWRRMPSVFTAETVSQPAF